MEKLCDCFKELISNGFVSFYTDGEHYLMPYIKNSNFRYNNCPCCGKETRSTVLTEAEFKELTDKE